MALGDAYIEAENLSEYLGVSDSDDSGLMTAACVAASAWVTEHCQRDFNKATTATARVYDPVVSWRADVDDFYDTTGLVIATDDNDDGTYEITWAASDYTLKPWNGIENGVTGVPYRTVVAAESRYFPCRTGRARLQVTALWGWAAIPGSVTLASQIVAGFLFNLKDSPLGVASFGDNGLIRVRDVPQAAMLLEKYRHPARTAPLVA